MYLETGLEILVKEWMELTCNGQTNLSLAEVVEKLGGDNWRGINGQLTPGQVAELIEEDMRRLGVLDNAETFMSRFRTEDELLAETSLYDLIRDFGVPQQYRRQPDEYQGQQA